MEQESAADEGGTTIVLALSYRSPVAIALWLGVFFAVLIWSGIRPKDYATWALEVFPAVIALAVLAATWRRFPLTPLVYWLILAHAVILMVGGHYTYAEVPLGDWFRDLTGGSRNDYDKLGHFAQGFVPAMITREILVRLGVIARRGWLGFIVVAICLAVSAAYEFLEWWVALLSDEAAESFLGTQGYVWDTQSDMFHAVVGAVAAMLLLSRVHDRQMRRIADIPVR
jgi:putative membrane protein